MNLTLRINLPYSCADTSRINDSISALTSASPLVRHSESFSSGMSSAQPFDTALPSSASAPMRGAKDVSSDLNAYNLGPCIHDTIQCKGEEGPYIMEGCCCGKRHEDKGYRIVKKSGYDNIRCMRIDLRNLSGCRYVVDQTHP